MKKLFILAAVSAAAALSSYAQINSPASDGYLTRAICMYDDGNYNGCLDQLTKVDQLALTDTEAELALFYRAAATVHINKALAIQLLGQFIGDYPASIKRDAAMMALGDCYYGNNYARALDIYNNVNQKVLDGAQRDDLKFRKAYCCLKLERFDQASQLFDQLVRSKEYRTASLFYEGYIAYCRGDYKTAESILTNVDTSKAPGNMADFYLSQIYYQRGEYRKALSMARNMLNQQNIGSSFVAEANRIAGESSYEIGDDNQAVKYLNVYASLVEKPMPSALYILGLDAYNRGQYKKAVEDLTPVTEMADAMGQSAYLYLGQAEMHLGDYTSAAMAFNRALNMHYDLNVQETAYYNYAVASMQGGKVPFASTVSIFSNFLKLYPNSRYASDVQEYIINSYLTDNNYDEALKSINEMKNPTDATLAAKQRVLYALGNRCLSSSQYRQALDYLTQAQKLSKYNADVDHEVSLALGEAYYRDGQYTNAENEINRYLKNTKASAVNRPLAYYDLGYAQYAQKQYDKAAKSFENMLKAPGDLSVNVVADAYNRLGDCYYWAKDFDKATEAYDKAFDANPDAGDYALFQKAAMVGYQRQYSQKIEMLRQMQMRFPSSALIPDALLETTECYIQLGNNKKAIDTYNQLVERFPNTAQGRQGYLQMALVKLNSGDHDGAVEAYKEVIRRYPTSDEAQQAIEQMKRVAATDGSLRDFMAFVNSVDGAPSMDESEIESLTFESAEKDYLTGGHVQRLEDFVEDYPDSALRPRALAYLIEGTLEAGDEDAAYDYACALATQYPDNTLAQQALLAKGRIEQSQGKGNLALDTWHHLARIASSPDMLLEARMGIIRNGREAGDYAKVLEAADAVLASSGVGNDDIIEATYSKALALNAKDNVREARKLWQSVADNTTNLYGLQSAFRLGESFFKAQDYKTAEMWAQKVANADTGHQYWQARGFILLSDVYAAQGDKYKARQYLEAVRDYYGGTEKDIFEMIDQRLK